MNEENENKLLDDLDELDNNTENDDDETNRNSEEENVSDHGNDETEVIDNRNIVDMFKDGDVDAFKNTIQQKVISTVAGVINTQSDDDIVNITDDE